MPGNASGESWFLFIFCLRFSVFLMFVFGVYCSADFLVTVVLVVLVLLIFFGVDGAGVVRFVDASVGVDGVDFVGVVDVCFVGGAT